MSPPIKKTGEGRDTANRRYWTVAFLLISLILIAGGYRYYRAEADRIYREKLQSISAVGELKAAQVCELRQGLLANVELLSRGPMIRKNVEELIREPSGQNSAGNMMDRFKLQKELGLCSDAWLLDLDGRILLSTSGSPFLFTPERKKSFDGLLAGEKVALSDLFQDQDGGTHLDATAVIRDSQNRPLAFVVLRNDASSKLFPLLDAWPTSSHSAETFLVKRDGDDVVYLNRGRLRPADNSLPLRLPISTPRLPAVQAVLGKLGSYDGLDYRGVEVISDLRPIPDSPWFMVNKIDAEEFLSDARNRAVIIALAVGVLVLLTALGLGFAHGRLRAAITGKAAARIDRLTHFYAAVSRCNQAIVHCSSKEELFREACQIAVDHGGMKMAWVGWAEGNSGRVDPVFSHGRGTDYLDGNFICTDAADPRGRGPVGTAIRTGQPVWCHHFQNDPNTKPWHELAKHYGWVSVASLPLFLGGKSVGSFNLYSDTAEAFDQDVRSLLVEMAGDMSFALDMFASRAEHRANRDKMLQLSLAVEQNPTSIVITDTRGNIEYVNQRFVELTGYTREEVAGKNPRLLKSGEKETDEYRRLWETILAGKEWRGEFHNRKKNGELYWENALISPIRSSTGEITRFLAVKEDITARKELESGLIQAKERAEAANIAKSEFLANMSHELRTPLNAIIGMSEIIEFNPTAAEFKECIATIRQNGDALLSLISSILDLSRIEAKKLVLERHPVNLRNLLESSLHTFLVEAAAKDLELRCQIDPALPSAIFGDVNRLRQVLLNLLANAVKFTDRGEVRLLAKRIAREGGGDFVRFSVRDTGPGIAPSEISELFRPFSQIDSSSTRRFGGSGLGLAVARRLVELMGGCIWVDSQPGKGSDFQFEIPLEPAETSGSVDEASASQLPDKSLATRCPMRVLVAEDNRVNQRVIGLVLGRLGYEPTFAENGAEALSTLTQHPCDLILMDIQMPVMDGLQAAAEVRRRYPGPAGPQIIAVTAHALEDDRGKCLAAGMDDYLSKPVRIDQLAAAIEGAHRRRGEADHRAG